MLRQEIVGMYLADLIDAQMRRLRPLRARRDWLPDTELSRSGADIDSIELVELATALFVATDAESSGALNQWIADRNALGMDKQALGRYFGDWCAFVEFALQAAQSLSFQTSGSRGQPQWVEHRVIDLQREVQAQLALIRAMHFAVKRVVCLVPMHHLYGFLFAALLPQFADIPVLRLAEGAAPMVRSQLKAGDLLIAHPLFWQQALDRPWPAGIAGVSSGQALAEVCFAAAQRAGLVFLLEIYGSTETAGVGYRNAAGSFQLLPRFETTGAAPTLLDTYQKPPKLTSLMDQVVFHGSDRFEVIGRIDAMVQVAGQNVLPSKVEQLISQFPNVRLAKVRLMQGRLHAFLVIDQQIDSTALHAHLAARLSDAEMPVSFRFGSALPTSAMGKDCDWLIE